MTETSSHIHGDGTPPRIKRGNTNPLHTRRLDLPQTRKDIQEEVFTAVLFILRCRFEESLLSDDVQIMAIEVATEIVNRLIIQRTELLLPYCLGDKSKRAKIFILLSEAILPLCEERVLRGSYYSSAIVLSREVAGVVIMKLDYNPVIQRFLGLIPQENSSST